MKRVKRHHVDRRPLKLNIIQVDFRSQQSSHIHSAMKTPHSQQGVAPGRHNRTLPVRQSVKCLGNYHERIYINRQMRERVPQSQLNTPDADMCIQCVIGNSAHYRRKTRRGHYPHKQSKHDPDKEYESGHSAGHPF